jgi:hypothetical protein
VPEIMYDELEVGNKIGEGFGYSVYQGKARGIDVAIKVSLLKH